jgi:hypothetical protein
MDCHKSGLAKCTHLLPGFLLLFVQFASHFSAIPYLHAFSGACQLFRLQTVVLRPLSDQLTRAFFQNIGTGIPTRKNAL